jgi:DNA-binding NtrC family response regulator
VPHHILIVDDEEALLFATQAYLQTCGYRVDCARDLHEATVALATSRYDVVITDLCLDGGRDTGGLAIISYAREHCPATRVLLWTAFLPLTVEQAARQYGADAFLCKSIPLPEVEEVVRSLLGGEDRPDPSRRTLRLHRFGSGRPGGGTCFDQPVARNGRVSRAHGDQRG